MGCERCKRINLVLNEAEAEIKLILDKAEAERENTNKLLKELMDYST